MLERIQQIQNSRHPYSGTIEKILELVNKITIYILIAVSFIGGVRTIVATVGLDKSDPLVNFFGYTIELEYDSLFGSPFGIFVHTLLAYALIVAAIFVLQLIFITLLESKMHLLDSMYRNEQFAILSLTANTVSPHTDDTIPSPQTIAECAQTIERQA